LVRASASARTGRERLQRARSLIYTARRTARALYARRTARGITRARERATP